jgi:DNA-binding NtrC family response regulator
MKNEFDGLVARLFSGGVSLTDAVGLLERSMIEAALGHHKGNQSAASKQLGIHRNTLQRKALEYGLDDCRGRSRRKPANRAVSARKRRVGAA